MQFTSVRAINAACAAACCGQLGGKIVYARKYREQAPQTPAERLSAHQDGEKFFDLVQISKARSERSGQLFVRHRGEWLPCQWSDVVVQ